MSLSAQGIFPLALVLEGVEYAGDGNKAWRPDWPLEIPPDAFRVLAGEVSRVTIEREGFYFNYRIGPEGLIEEFPFVLNGRVAQVSVVYQETEIRELTLSVPNEDPWKLEVLEHFDFYPSLVRGSRGENWYFIYLSRGVNEISETWYDEMGNALGVYVFSLIEIWRNQRIKIIREYSDTNNAASMVYYYDSRGFVTEKSGPDGVYKVLYFRDYLPRYWERRPAGITGRAEDGIGRYYLQWDQMGFLVRFVEEIERPDDAVDGLLDYRYEYCLDENGNWIERREIRMIRRFGHLVPTQGITIKRELEYRR
jgi:hypothetical protein